MNKKPGILKKKGFSFEFATCSHSKGGGWYPHVSVGVGSTFRSYNIACGFILCLKKDVKSDK